MENTENVIFDRQLNGYNKGQVNRYIAKMSEAYRAAYNEHSAECGRYNDLLEAYKKLEEKEQSRPGADVIAKTLVDAETLAHKIIADANAEAATIIAEARISEKTISEEARAEVETARQRASRIIEDSYLESSLISSQAKKDREQADEIIENTIAKLLGIMTQKRDGADTRQTSVTPVGACA